MSVVIHLRNLPDEVHRKLKARAELAEKPVKKPTRREFLERLRGHGSVELKVSVVDVLAEEREER